KILIGKCQRSIEKFRELIKNNPKIRKQFESKAAFDDTAILVRNSDKKGYYRVLDGMHRFIGAILSNKKTIQIYLPINEKECLPVCEAHTVYDLIRAFERNTNDKEGEKELYYALKLLSRTYSNVKGLLSRRFNKNYVHNEDVQKIIQKIIRN
ncbi:MAG: hypothetical protein M1338_02255, partial [Patescibacteria group bacterium]|nr:hypothetical protein [Patescibacteria group bacterium]